MARTRQLSIRCDSPGHDDLANFAPDILGKP
jgi:hypothetical protein